MLVTHPLVMETLVAIRRAGDLGVASVTHPHDYVRRRRFEDGIRPRRARS